MEFFPAKLNDQTYLKWREQKLAFANRCAQSRLVNIKNAASLGDSERNTIITDCLDHNFALYQFDDPIQNEKTAVHAFAKQLGLHKLDGNLCADQDSLTSITVTKHKGQHDYIPYTPKKLSWHTDGYYNTKQRQINGMILHCATPASTGGESLFMDHELAYLLLRDKNPDYVNALFANDALTIPANIINGEVIRAAQTGPVFSTNSNGQLHMRYSARLRNIEWKDDPLVREATEFLQNLWRDGSDLIIKHTLKPGQGVICNNVLHCRTAFENTADNNRLLFRGRYYEAVNC